MESGFPAWHERMPARLDRERQSFRDAGLELEIDDQALRDWNLVVFRGDVDIGGQARPLSVWYPPGFPFARPEVFSSKTQLDRHQHPYAYNLCLLENNDTAWDGASMTGADLARQAISLLTDSLVGGPAIVHDHEVDAPEPRSTYYPYAEKTSLLVPANMQNLPERSWGQFKVLMSSPNGPFRGVMKWLSVNGRKGGRPTEREAPTGFQELFTGSLLSGLWFRASTPPPWITDFGELKRWARRQVKDFDHHLPSYSFTQPRRPGWNVVEALAICYPEEGPARGEYHDTWLMGIHWADEHDQPQVHLLRPHLINEPAAFARAPFLQPLRSKRVAIVGLGALGSEIALRLARAGVGVFHVIDYDLVEYGNLARHESDLHDLGLPKTEAIARRIKAINPEAQVTYESIRFGGFSSLDAPETDANHLSDFAGVAAQCDLVIGATGTGSVNHLLNRISHATTTPLLFCWVTNGAWGGEMLRVIPGESACYECMALHGADGTLLDEPQADPDDDPLFPLGCGFPTFPGAGFDTGSIAILSTRLAVQTILRAEPDTYPDAPYHYLQVSNRGIESGPWPEIRHATIPPHRDCTVCRTTES